MDKAAQREQRLQFGLKVEGWIINGLSALAAGGTVVAVIDRDVGATALGIIAFAVCRLTLYAVGALAAFLDI